MLDTVKINHVQHISFTQSRLTDAVSVILSELLSYEHPSKVRGAFFLTIHSCLGTEPIQHGCGLGTGGRAAGQQGVAAAVDDPGGIGPLHGFQRVGRDL